MQDNLFQNQQQPSANLGKKASNLDKDNLLPSSKRPNINGKAGFNPVSASLGQAFDGLGKGLSSFSGAVSTQSIGSQPVQRKDSMEEEEGKVQLKINPNLSGNKMATGTSTDIPIQAKTNGTLSGSSFGAFIQKKAIPVNDDANLEQEADVMGVKAARNERVSIGGAAALAPTVQKKAVVQRQTGEQALDRIASQQAIYEYAAHHLVYQQEGSQIQQKEYRMLISSGYNPDKIQWYGLSTGAQIGFQAVLIPSRTGEKNHILAIRGTVPGGSSEELLTIYTDLDPQTVGATQFATNRMLIERILEEADGMVDVTGHSLGGAMAQHIAVNFSGHVGNVATFQSPGIDQESVDRFNNLPENERPEVVHHIVTGDIVDKAGDASLPGDVFEHDFGASLDVRVLLNTLTTSITEIKADITLFNQTVREILDIIRPQLRTPIGSFRDLGELYQKIQLLSVIKNRIQQNVQELRAYLSSTASTIGESHGTHVFGASHFNSMRSEIGMDDSVMGANLERGADVSHYESYPHQEQRAVAEPMRQSAGRALQNIFRAYISVVQTYESTVDRYNRFKQGASNAWDGFTQGVRDGMSAARDRINRAWDWVTNW
ncbi:hypothetical protein LVD17_20260 [Fulvivirga ulvae]|uniref:hypothetical protein n=1 Tax=Fulvivirga ulvae TaxID=2904245 RepID=UPI001F3F0047|nr:hypothetical protein [Fulvivirga ulvae]UII30630.1 hypothetical protein LVD17_20260 [Fulvivirga ulvae]